MSGLSPPGRPALAFAGAAGAARPCGVGAGATSAGAGATGGIGDLAAPAAAGYVGATSSTVAGLAMPAAPG